MAYNNFFNPMQNNPYINPQAQGYMNNLQNLRNQIDNQMMQIQQQPQQQPTAINQTFQLANNTSQSELESKYASNIDEVKNTTVFKDNVFINRDMTYLWFKSVNGSIKTYTLSEVIELDEKDKKILDLQKQIERMEMILNDKSDSNVNANNDEPITRKKSTNGSNDKNGSK